MKDLDIGILSPKPLSSRQEGREFLSLLCNSLPEFIPERYGNHEPIRKKFNVEQIEDILNSWKWPFLWTRQHPSVEGNIWMRDTRAHGTIYISAESRWLDLIKIEEFFKQVSILVNTDFAYIHILTKQEAKSVIEDELLMPFRQGVTTHLLRKYLPNICWGTVLGPPYVRLFGRKQIFSAPAYKVVELAQETFYIQLSENLSDLKSRYSEIDAVRQQVKKHLNNNAFFDPQAEVDHKYNVPEFQWKD
ncbi:MAG: hypothetical protein AB1489_33670 [Acidobacteriota bacterium]